MVVETEFALFSYSKYYFRTRVKSIVHSTSWYLYPRPHNFYKKLNSTIKEITHAIHHSRNLIAAILMQPLFAIGLYIVI